MDRIGTVAFFFCRRMIKSTSFPPLSQIDASSQMTVTEACAIIDPRGVHTTPHVMLLLIPFFPDKMFPGKMFTDFPNSTPQFIFLGQCHFVQKTFLQIVAFIQIQRQTPFQWFTQLSILTQITAISSGSWLGSHTPKQTRSVSLSCVVVVCCDRLYYAVTLTAQLRLWHRELNDRDGSFLFRHYFPNLCGGIVSGRWGLCIVLWYCGIVVLWYCERRRGGGVMHPRALHAFLHVSWPWFSIAPSALAYKPLASGSASKLPDAGRQPRRGDRGPEEGDDRRHRCSWTR